MFSTGPESRLIYADRLARVRWPRCIHRCKQLARSLFAALSFSAYVARLIESENRATHRLLFDLSQLEFVRRPHCHFQYRLWYASQCLAVSISLYFSAPHARQMDVNVYQQTTWQTRTTERAGKTIAIVCRSWIWVVVYC